MLSILISSLVRAAIFGFIQAAGRIIHVLTSEGPENTSPHASQEQVMP